MSNEIVNMDCEDRIYLSVACDYDEYAWETTEYHNGCWTQCFLHYSWIDYYSASGTITVETICDKADIGFNLYVATQVPSYTSDQNPYTWDGDGSNSFYLSKQDIYPT